MAFGGVLVEGETVLTRRVHSDAAGYASVRADSRPQRAIIHPRPATIPSYQPLERGQNVAADKSGKGARV